MQNTPKWTASGTFSYSTPVGDGDLYAGTTLSYRSKTNQFEIANPFIDQKGFALWDANLVYNAPDKRWSVGLHGKNLTNKRYKTSGYTFVAADPTTGAIGVYIFYKPTIKANNPRMNQYDKGKTRKKTSSPIFSSSGSGGRIRPDYRDGIV